jgi:hypothetical protein
MFGLLPKATLYILAIALAVYLGVQYVPIYFDALQFHDQARQAVRFASASRKTVDDVRREIMDLAKEFAVPVLEENVDVEVRIQREGPVFYVEIFYEVLVDHQVYQHSVSFDWRFAGETFV